MTRTRYTVHGRRCLCLLVAWYGLTLTAPAAPDTPATGADNEASVSADELNASIDRVIANPRYAWRLPREIDEAPSGTRFKGKFWTDFETWVRRVVRRVFRFFRDLSRWMDRLFRRTSHTGHTEVNWPSILHLLLFVVLAATGSLLAVMLYRWFKYGQFRRPVIHARATPAVPDITDERVLATDLPTDEWMRMATDFLQRGEWRLAIRAMFLACLASLAQTNRLAIAPHKSNREYWHELRRKAHDHPALLDAFAGNVGILERVWYGNHPATDGVVVAFQRNHDTIVTDRPDNNQREPAA